MRSVVRLAMTGLLAAATAVVFQPAEAEAQRRDRDVITREELVNSSQKNTDLYSAVRSLRSHMLQGPRGATRSIGGANSVTERSAQAPPAVLYINGSRSGDITMMRSIQTMHVEEVRYLSPNAAGNQFGTGHEGGAILVKLVSGG